MKFKGYLGGAVAVASLVMAGSAAAYTIDFGYMAQNVSPYEQGYGPAPSGLTINIGASTTLTATGTTVQGVDSSGNSNYYAYLDGYSGGMPGGLGVCENLTSANQCNPSSDDSMKGNEMLTLTFNHATNVGNIWFRNGDQHSADFASNASFDLSVDGGAWASYNLNANNPFMSGSYVNGTTFKFRTTDWNTTQLTQMYINKITVPEPSTLALMGLGLIGAGLAARKRKSKA